MTFIFLFTVVFLGAFNLLRVAIYLIASDINDVKSYKSNKVSFKLPDKFPIMSVIIPAYNEELSIYSSIASVCKNTYRNYEVIVVDDGSKDNTSRNVKKYIKDNPKHKVKLIRQKNKGKACALNNAINHSRGSLVMCLDADSLIAEDGVEKAVNHFRRNDKLVALASNMKILNSDSVICTAQQLEYIVGNRFKRALNTLRTEYIIGGIGSSFRKKHIKKIGLYDSDTMTEDIDLTMKIIKILGNTKYEVGYGYDVHTYTQGVEKFSDLIKQRYRWKFGRMQTFYKNRKLFFSRDKKYSKTLTHFQLPHAFISDWLLLLEPLMIFFIIYLLILTGQIYTILWATIFMTIYVGIVLSNNKDDNRSFRSTLKLYSILPFAYLLFYIITIVDFIAFIKCLTQLKSLPESISTKSTSQWEHVKRVAM